jgi:nucleobase:cation symporter-1, NCS1 family
MNVMGGFFGPVAGILLADYLVVRRMRIDVPALFEKHGRYWYWGGFNWIAVAWTALGFAGSAAELDHRLATQGELA